MLMVKICGLTNAADAVAAAAAGADAAGFVLAESPRRVTPAQAKAVCTVLPPEILRVGVFVAPEAAYVEEAMAEIGLDLAQIHGDLPREFWQRLGNRAIRAVSVGRHPPGADLAFGPPRYLLLDTYHPKLAGGTGRHFDWIKAEAYCALGLPCLIAGGLNPSNVRSALAAARPAGVDVSSGVEEAPGRKDHRLMRAFIAAVRAWERESTGGKPVPP